MICGTISREQSGRSDAAAGYSPSGFAVSCNQIIFCIPAESLALRNFNSAGDYRHVLSRWHPMTLASTYF